MSHSNEHYSFADENNRRAKIQTAVSRVLEASAVKHQGTREYAVNAIIANISQNHTFRIADRGWVQVENHIGNPVDLTKLVQDILLIDRNIGDPESIAAAVRSGSIDVGSKEELTTPKQKSDFITRFGYDIWAKLPQRREAPISNDPDNMTADEFKRAPMSVKVKMSEQQISDALRRK